MRVLARIARTPDGATPYEARIIKRLGASAHRVLGVLRLEQGQPPRIEPIDRKTRYALVIDREELSGAKNGELVLAEPMARHGTGGPRGRIVERLGSMDDPKAVSLIAIHAHGIPTEFPREALQEAQSAKPVGIAGRTDLRKIPLITIDPEDARDHDDAVWAEPDSDPANKGGHIVIVAIADVAHYVTPGSALDREAEKRGNSVYFPDRVVPMLPEALSADLCSLRENEERACLAVRMVFDSRGVKRRHEFLRGPDAFGGAPDLCRSAARLRRQARREIGAAAGEHHAAFVGRLSHARSGARRAFPARSRSARAAHHHRRGRQNRIDRLSRAPGIHAADRRVHDHGECGGGRIAGESAPAR